MSKSEDSNQENILKWAIRYVLIPITLAITAGWFALEVVYKQFELQQQLEEPITNEEILDELFARMTAVAPTNEQPTPTLAATSLPTAEATPTLEAEEVETAEPGSSKLNPEQPPQQPSIICGPVPYGWLPYTVQPGNTLYSLARKSGTSIEAIRQANCLYGQLKAYSQIWLPELFFVKPEPPVEEPAAEETSVENPAGEGPGAGEPATPVTPTITVTPTTTVTVVPALPDLINNTANGPTIDVNCSTVQGGCFTTVNLAVTNAGKGSAAAFDILVSLDPDQAVTLRQPVAGLEPGETAAFSLTSPPGGNCYDPDCTVCVTVDSNGAVNEDNEGNNQFCTTFQG